MALYRINDFDPNYRQHFNGDDIKDLDLYSGDQRIGSVDDVLVDEAGRFRYLVINTGAWIFGKRVLLPIGQSRMDFAAHRVYADNLSRAQVESLPAFNEDMVVDYDHEERVRSTYRSARQGTAQNADYLDNSAPIPATPSLDNSAALNATAPLDTSYAVAADYGTGTDRSGLTPEMAGDRNYRYEQDPDLYQMNDRDHQVLRLYEERLIAGKNRQKTGEVAVGKRVETETAQVSVPITRERVVIERTVPTDATAVPGEQSFREGEVARMEVFEETPDIQKQAFVREEVRVRKVVDQDTVRAEDEIRREQLDVKTNGEPLVEGGDPNRRDRL